MSGLGLVAWLVLAQLDGGAKPAVDVERLPFTQETVKQVIDANVPKIQGCYNELLAGMVKTSWEITAEGLVSKAKVEKKGTTLKDPKLHECVVVVLSSMTFPKPPDGKVHPIEYPFNLKAQH